MKRILSIPFGWVLPALITVMLGGCVDDRYTSHTPSGDEVQLLVELNVPGVSTATRSLTKIQEGQIDKLDVLVFEVDGGTETFAYKTYGAAESTTENKFKVNFKKSEGGKTYRFVFLANLRTEVNAAITTAFTSTPKSKAEILAAITFEAFPASTPSPWNTSSSPRYLPMWGESASTHTVDANLHFIPKIYMLRSVARVDILMNPDDSSTPLIPNKTGFNDNGNFLLTGVRVYNASSCGAAAPVAQVGTLPTEVGSTGVTSPSIPSTNPRGMIEYNYSDLAEQLISGMFRDIYIAESANTKTENSNTINIDEDKMTCVVIEITDTNNGDTKTWYRLDFIKDQATGLRWDILRNYCYTFKIKSISGQGYGTPEEAFDAHPVNLEYEMEVLSESGITATVFNGQYMLGVSKREYYMLSEVAHTASDTDNQLTITTSYTGGWTIASIIDQTTHVEANWIRISPQTTSTTNGTTTVSLILDPNKETDASVRSTEITITAGMLSITVRVEQKNETVWAGSNIYWDTDTKTLTFDNVNDHKNETHQGVYFKWGSLWGISPSGASWADNSTVVYKPNTTNTGYTESTSATWGAIPFWDPGTITANRDQKYLTDVVHTVAANIASGYGDICKYLTEQAGGKLHGKKWRLPTPNEFNSVAEPSEKTIMSNNNTDYEWLWTGTAATANAAGTATFPNGVRKSLAVGTPFFPAAGCRNYLNGALDMVDTGFYWSASPGGASCYFMLFNNTAMNPSANTYRAQGFSVRCVAE